jgi:predicted transcriptional regulator
MEGKNMLEVLFGGKNAERVLQYVLAKENGYIREIAEFYDVSPSVIKKQIDKFENANILVGKNLANIRMYELNKRYAFYNELTSLLLKARSLYPDNERINLVRKGRTRPRSNKKPLIMRNEND